MSRKLTIIGLIALSTTLLYAGFSVSKAQLVAEQTHHDLGVVAPNEEVVHEFRLRKSGWGSLQITKVRRLLRLPDGSPAKRQRKLVA